MARYKGPTESFDSVELNGAACCPTCGERLPKKLLEKSDLTPQQRKVVENRVNRAKAALENAAKALGVSLGELLGEITPVSVPAPVPAPAPVHVPAPPPAPAPMARVVSYQHDAPKTPLTVGFPNGKRVAGVGLLFGSKPAQAKKEVVDF